MVTTFTYGGRRLRRLCKTVVLPEPMGPLTTMKPWASSMTHRYAAATTSMVLLASRSAIVKGFWGYFLITNVLPNLLTSAINETETL